MTLQGVEQLAPGSGKSKIIVTMRPDTTFAGAHADLMRVLHLDDVGSHYGGSQKSHGARAGGAAQEDEDEYGGAGGGLERAGTLLRAGASTVGQEEVGKGKGKEKDRYKRKQSGGADGGEGKPSVEERADDAKAAGEGGSEGGSDQGSASRDGDSREHLSREGDGSDDEPGEDGEDGAGSGGGGRRNSTGSVDTMAIEQAKLHKHSCEFAVMTCPTAVSLLRLAGAGCLFGCPQAASHAFRDYRFDPTRLHLALPDPRSQQVRLRGAVGAHAQQAAQRPPGWRPRTRSGWQWRRVALQGRRTPRQQRLGGRRTAGASARRRACGRCGCARPDQVWQGPGRAWRHYGGALAAASRYRGCWSRGLRWQQ